MAINQLPPVSICSLQSHTSFFSLLINLTQAPNSLPDHVYTKRFCNTIVSIFTNKIFILHQELISSQSTLKVNEILSPPVSSAATCSSLTFHFRMQMIKQSKYSTCLLDPSQQQLLKPAYHPQPLSLLSSFIPQSIIELQQHI